MPSCSPAGALVSCSFKTMLLTPCCSPVLARLPAPPLQANRDTSSFSKMTLKMGGAAFPLSASAA